MLKETAPQVSARVIKRGTELPLNHRRTYADLRALDRALVMADLPAARAAFHRLQEDSPFIAKALSREPFPVKTRPLRALKALGRCLLSGDLPRARQAFELFC
jgi:hypothetical protein